MTLKARVSKLEGFLSSVTVRPDFIIVGSPQVERQADGRLQIVPNADSLPGFAIAFSESAVTQIAARPNETMLEFEARLSKGTNSKTATQRSTCDASEIAKGPT